MDALAAQRVSADFDIELDRLIEERGAGCKRRGVGNPHCRVPRSSWVGWQSTIGVKVLKWQQIVGVMAALCLSTAKLSGVNPEI